MSTSRSFRFGVLGENATTPGTLVDTARQAERLGYDTFLLRDHYVREPFGDQLAPMVALAATAAATTTIRLGTLVLANDYRHPVMLAKEAATLDALSGGRFELGLGAGWLREEYERAGMPFESGGRRVDRLEESLAVLKGLLRGEPVTFNGKHYRLDALTTFPAVVQRPHPPILMGAGSPRMLRLAGREADTVGILGRALPDGTISDARSERTPEMIARKIDWIREGAGPRFGDVELSMIVNPLITDDVAGAAEQYAAWHGWEGMGPQAVLEMPTVVIGTVERIADVLRARREQYGFSYYVVPDAIAERFAPVVERLAGG